MKYWMEDSEFSEKEEAKVKAKLKVFFCDFIRKKTEEQIQQFTLDDKLPPCKNALILLTSQNRDQRLAILRNLEMYLDDPLLIPTIMPKICVFLTFLIMKDCITEWPASEHGNLAETVTRLFKKKV